MNADALITAAVVVLVLVGLARDLAPPAVVVLSAVTALMLTDVLDTSSALAGFANPAPFTVAALYVVARAVERTGVVTAAVEAVLGDSTGPRQMLTRMMAPVIGMSAFMNNTPVVAVIAPALTRWCEAHRFPASRLLIPLSYAAILGGTLTAIGTSTTLVVSGLMQQQGMAAIGLLEPLRVAGPAVVIGALITIIAAPRLLPDRQALHEVFRQGAKEFAMGLTVTEGGPVDGLSIADAGLRALPGVYCVQVRREGGAISPVAPEQRLHGGDELTFVGDVQQVVDLQQRRGLAFSEAHHAAELGGDNQRFFEAVIGPSSPLVGTTLKDFEFRSRYDAAVVAIHRAGAPATVKLGEVRLRSGDTLLCVSDPTFGRRAQGGGAFVLVSELDAEPALDTRRARLVAIVLTAMVIAAGTGVLSILEASLAAAITLVLGKVLTTTQAKNAVDTSVILVIGGAFALGAALEQTGLARGIADLVVSLVGGLGEPGLALAAVLLVVILTELVTNNAAAVLAFPIVQSLAQTAGADVRSWLVITGVAASLSFITPLGYQTNLMVYGVGGYRFGDFARLGIPVSVACCTALTLTMAT